MFVDAPTVRLALLPGQTHLAVALTDPTLALVAGLARVGGRVAADGGWYLPADVAVVNELRVLAARYGWRLHVSAQDDLAMEQRAAAQRAVSVIA